MRVFSQLISASKKTNKQNKTKKGGSAFRLGLIYILASVREIEIHSFFSSYSGHYREKLIYRYIY